MFFRLNQIIVIFFGLIILTGFCEGRSLVNPGSVGSGPKPTVSATLCGTSSEPSFTCQCGDKFEPICGDNGVTYQNKCRFDCAKKKNGNLQISREGSCGILSKLLHAKNG